ncbi:MAG: hypothetical protein EHM41_00910 [Chloroflexi bacterium]|nr:MAG: hypothetical protein EHM41_00910 [Chloroflexota bacterium]
MSFDVKFAPLGAAPVQATHGAKTKMKYSNYSFMFNTNSRPKTAQKAREYDRIIRKCLTDMMKEDVFPKFVIFLPGPEGTHTWDDVRGVKVRSQTEIGPSKRFGGRLHVHGYMEISHIGKIRLDYSGFQDKLNEMLSAASDGQLAFNNMRWKWEKTTPEQYMRKEEADVDVNIHDEEEEEEDDIPDISTLKV